MHRRPSRGVQRHIEEGLLPKDAARKAMQSASGPVIVSRCSVCGIRTHSFIPGITGRLYQQFAVTIRISVPSRLFNALTLSPALAALLRRPKKQNRGLLARFFDWSPCVWTCHGGIVRYLRPDPQERRAIVALVVLSVAAGFLAADASSSCPMKIQAISTSYAVPNAARCAHECSGESG